MGLINLSFVLCLATIILNTISIYEKKRFLTLLIHAAGGLAVLSLFAVLIIRSVEIKFPALTNLYEAFLFFSMILMIVGIGLTIAGSSKAVTNGVFVLALLILVLASSPIFSDELKPPVPALRSNWLVLHVACAFAGEGFFAAAFISSLLWLFTRNESKKSVYETITYRSIIAGYPLFTLGALVFGAIWASSAWGRFWSWDPKETWALITWMTYTFYLHSRFIMKKRRSLTQWISIGGFIFTLVTFIGIRFIELYSNSLHSY